MLTRNRNFEKITGQIFNAKLLKFESRFLKKTQQALKKGPFLGGVQKRVKKGGFWGGVKNGHFWSFSGHPEMSVYHSQGDEGEQTLMKRGGGYPPKIGVYLTVRTPFLGGGSGPPLFGTPNLGPLFQGFQHLGKFVQDLDNLRRLFRTLYLIDNNKQHCNNS